MQALNFVKIGDLYGGDKFVVITLDLFGTWDTAVANKETVSFTLSVVGVSGEVTSATSYLQ